MVLYGHYMSLQRQITIMAMVMVGSLSLSLYTIYIFIYTTWILPSALGPQTDESGGFGVLAPDRLSKRTWASHGLSHMLHVWYIYLQNWVIFRANVGKYTIHGAYDLLNSMFYHGLPIIIQWFSIAYNWIERKYLGRSHGWFKIFKISAVGWMFTRLLIIGPPF